MENKEGVDKPKSMEYHRQVLQNRLAEDQYVSFSLHRILMGVYYFGQGQGLMIMQRGKQVYISPSDAVLSPCTQKLSAYKGKSFMK